MADIKVKESVRRVISRDGAEQKLHNVRSLNISGSWTRMEADEGYAVVNPANVLMYIIKGERKF